MTLSQRRKYKYNHSHSVNVINCSFSEHQLRGQSHSALSLFVPQKWDQKGGKQLYFEGKLRLLTLTRLNESTVLPILVGPEQWD